MTQPLEIRPIVAPAEPRARANPETVASPPPTLHTAASAGGSGSSAEGSKTATTATTAAASSATRLLVEPSKGVAGFVYKVVDRTTGQVLSEFPREAAKSLAQSSGYQAGAVLDESA